MPIENKKVKTLYDALVSDGADVGTEDEFSNWFFAKGEQGYKNRKTVFDAFKEDGADVGENYEEFASLLGLQAVAKQKPAQNNQAFDPAEFQQTINSARQTVGKSQQAVNRIGNMQQRMGLDLPQEPIRLGQNKKVTKGEQRFNLDKGEMENTYITESGNEYNTRAAADLEQNAVDDAMRRELNPITTQIEDLEAEQRRIEELLQQSVDEQYSNKGLLDRIGAAGLGSPSTGDFRNASDYLLANPKARDLMAAYRKNMEALTILEDQRDQKTNEFWHSLGTEISNGYNFSLGGSTRIDDIAALNRARKYKDIINEKNSRGEELTNEERVAEAVLKNAAWDQHVQSEYGDNYGAWARAGKMGAVSADFMLDFLMGGGLPAGLAKGIMNGVVKGGTKLAGNLATKGLGKYMLKATGATLGSMVAGAGITNTLQIGKTAADIGNLMMGDVYRDNQGNYIFGHYEEDKNGNPVFVQGGNDFLDALITAERNGTAENASEILGEFLPGGSQVVKVLDKIGLSKISKGLTALKGKGWYQGYQKFLQTAGFHGVPGEGMEEYAGTFLDALMGGDEWKNLKDPKTHIDIWLGVTTMGAILGTPNVIGTGYSAVQYQRYKKKLGIADSQAGSVISPEKWSQIREQIDGTTNENMADMVMSILSNDDLSDEGKRAAMNYVSDLQKMRGYSMASASAGKTEDGESAEPTQADEIDQSYTEGYNSQEPDLMKQYNDEAQEATANLPQYGKEFAKMVMESESPVETMDYLMQNRDSFTDEQIAAAADYYQKMSRVNGVMDGALSRIDLEVERMKADIRANTHQATGNVYWAKGADDVDYNVIGGDIMTDPDTGLPVLTGTGGAVVVRDQFGNVSVKSPQELTMYSMRNADEMINVIDTEIRQQLTQQADDDITYGSPANEVFDLEDTVTLQDGNGGLIEGQVVTLPNAVDGVFVIQTADGKALQMTSDDINRRIVAHNGQEVQRNGNITPGNIPGEGNISDQNIPTDEFSNQKGPENGQEFATTESESLKNQPQAAENETVEKGQNQEQQKPQSALLRIPVRTDKDGIPLKNKKGRPILDWHKASVEDAAAALIETTGGNMVMARDTASDLVRQAQDRKEKIAKQKPKGEDPIEIAESRMEIQRQIEEQQAIIKQWQDVNTAIRKQMEAESAERRAAEEAAKSAEQKAREAEEARIRKEKQDAIDAERRRKKIEEELANWNKPYAPLAKARKDMENDPDALDILNRTEPETLEEWVSSLIQPQSMMWDDETDPTTGRTVIGLQSELGLQKKDIERIGGLVASRQKGGRPFGQVVHDIWEQLPEGMKNMYDDQDVRNTLISLFGEGNTVRMRHLTEEHRIEEAREMIKENARRDAEAELEAWAEANHLTPEERETFEDYLEMPPTDIEEEVINQIIADNEQNRTSGEVDQQPVGGTDGTENEGGNRQVLQAAQPESERNTEKRPSTSTETGEGKQAVSDDTLAGGTPAIETEDPLVAFVNAARNGDVEAQKRLERYGVDWEKKPVVRFVAKGEVDSILNGGRYEGKFGDGRVDVTNSNQVTTAATADYRITFKDDLDWTLSDRVRMKNKDLGDGWIMDGYSLDDVATIEKRNEDGTYTIIYNQKNNNENERTELETQSGGAGSGTEMDHVDTGNENAGGNVEGKGSMQETQVDSRGNGEADYGQPGIRQAATRADAVNGLPDRGVSVQAEGKAGIVEKSFIKDLNKLLNDYDTGDNGYLTERDLIEQARSLADDNLPNNSDIAKRLNDAFAEYDDMQDAYYNENGQRDDDGSDAMIETLRSLVSAKPKAEPAKKPAQPKKKEPKRLVSDEKMEELRKQILAKLNNLNAGVDPEMMLLGGMYAVGTIERGVTKFADYAREMISALSDNIRPYLKAFYNSVRDMPGAEEYASQLDDYETVKNFDVYNFDKQQAPDVITKAEQVVKEQKINKQAKKIKAEQPDLFAGDLFGREAAVPQQQTQQQPIGKTSSKQEIKAEEAKVDTNPSDAQKEAGNYQKGHINIDGYDITIENPKGSIRRGTDRNGKKWEIEVQNTYGYIRGTEGIDGDHIDVFLSDDPASGQVFVVDQVKPDGSFDEHKVMYGFASLEEAREAYLSNYGKGWKGLGDITEASRETFKEWINSSHRKTKPFAEYALIKKQQANTFRPATEEDLEAQNPKVYYQGKRVYIVAITRTGEQTSATTFSKPNISSIMLTNGKTIKLSDLEVKDDAPAKPKLNKNDYHSYMTPEAREYFAKDPRFAKFPHKELAFITAAVWDGVVIPVDELAKVPEIVEAEQRVKAKEQMKPFSLTDEQVEQYAKRLLDAEHGSAVYEDGKLHKVDGNEDFSGPVRQERKAFVIIGRPAGGKSSVFANPLSNQHGARIIDSDVVKEWFDEFDDGYGAGYVQNMSSKVAEKALDMAAQNGDNIILPRIGGNSVMTVSVALRALGYDVQLYYNDVVPDTSYMRSTSRFAMTGRYLSLDYLTSIKDKPSKNFSNFAEKNIGDYLDECTEEQVQKLRGRIESLAGGQRSDLLRAIDGWLEQKGRRNGNDSVSADVERSGSDGASARIDFNSPIFSYSEWKSNDVAFGEKPKEIWNSESGKPMPTNERTDNESKRKVSTEPREAGEGTGQASGPAGRAGAEPGTESDRTQRTGSGYSVDNSVAEAQQQTQQPAKPKQDLHKNKRNNQGERGKDYAPTSLKARFNANVEAIKMMRALMEDGVETPTKDQMEVLRQYSGWGGMGTYFNDENSAENKQLRDLLSDEEYSDAVMSINSAYFTPATVIDSMWDIAKAMGFKGGNVLEGSAGIGNIIGQMPTDMSRRSNIEAVEIDKISGNILKLLYPDAKVNIQGFQDTVIPNGSVDLAITNVPFVTGLHVFDKVDKDLSRRFTNIHDFCIAKNIRKLKEGGIGIFISSSGTLDKSTDLRQWIGDEGQADVVGAFRLNNETFGGTTATSDIIVVRKRTGNQKSPAAIDVIKASPLRIGSYEDKYGDEHQVSMVVNDYFGNHPENMAGEMFFGYEKGDTFRPGSYGLYPVEGKDQDKMLADFAKSMSKAKEVAVPQQQTQQKEQVQNQLTAEKEGRMLVDDNGRLCVSQRGVAVPLGLNDQKVKGYTKAECFKDYQAVQKAVDDVLQQQLSDPDDAALKPKLDALNKAYDKFTKRYGTLHKNTAISFLRNDIDFPSFQALENYSETKDMNGKVTIKTAKAPLFSQRVLGFKTEPKPKTIKDALIASIFRSNGIDLAWIAERLNDAGVKPPHKEQWDEEDVRKGILVSRLGFEDPSTGQLEIRYKYLSGNVREKLAIAEAYNTDGKYSANVEELRKAVPMDIPSHLIDFSLGSSWIPTELYKDYLKETLDLDNVKLSHLEGTWVLDEGYSYRKEKNRSAGVYSEKFRETIYGHQLVAAALNNRPVKVSKQVSEGWGSSKTTKTVVDKAATQACAVRVDEIKDEFKQWAKKKMQDNPELSQRIEKIYNDKFNALVPMQIDDEFLPETFDGANMNISLYDHQKRGVMRGLTAPTMLAHEVGTGKSFTLISTAMEMRRLGTAKKPMIVVQNATVVQLTSDAKLLYPNAKVLSLSEKDRTAEGRRAFYAKIKFNDWDLIIVPQSTFERIPDSPERELQFIQEKIDEKKHVIEAAQAAGVDSRELQRLKKELQKIEDEYGDTYLDRDPANGGTNKTKKKDAKREAASLDKAETKAKEQLDRAVDDVQFFDDLGVDALLVDEAHEYKHLGFQTSIGRGIKGIDPSYSKKCAGLYNKTRSVFEKAGWKNVVFATGTPISNTAAEIWTFMKYLMPADTMKANDIYYFDDFVHNFGNISQMLEFATSGKFKENTRFAAYVNKPELIRIWSQVADTVLTREVGAVKSKVPEKEGGKDQDVFLPQSPSLIRIMAAVRAELERFENMDGKQKKENSHIPLTMYGIAKRAAIDPRLVDADAKDEPLSKTNAAVKEIVKDLKDTQSYKGTVAVFCDNQNRKGADGSIEFNIYDDMREKLIAQGVPADQIAIIKSGMSIAAKQKVFDAVNSGAIRVVLGSTQTLGTGVNMQERLHLLIHMDAPDRPMDYTQRNGRIERQGNLHKVWGKPIRIVRFGVEDSLDVTAYQRLKTKSGFIDSIMDGKGALANNQVDRTVEEEEEGLFDNPVAVLSGSQYALKKNQAERELRKYQGKKAQWEADQVYITNTLRYNKSALDSTKNNIDEEEQKLAKIKGMFPDGKVKTITVEGVKVDMTKDDGAKKLGEAIKEKINDPVNATVKKMRENEIYNDETHQYTIELDGHPVNFTVSIYRTKDWEGGKIKTTIHKGTSYASPDLMSDSMMSARSVKDYLDELLDQVVTGRDSQDRIEAYQAKIDRINQESEQMRQREGQPFQFDKELEQARKNVEEYTELMNKEMEEKEAKYAQQQKEAETSGNTFNLSKAEENNSEDEELYRLEEEEEPMLREVERFEDGDLFPIHKSVNHSSYNVLGTRNTYSVDLLPDSFSTQQALLDAVRNQNPEYFATIEGDSVMMQTWDGVMASAQSANTARRLKSKGTESYIERKTRNAINAVEYLADKMGLDVEILTTTEGLEGKKALAKGSFNPNTGKITIILPNHKTQSDVIRTLLHEGVAHFGLRKMFGEHFDTFLDNVYNNAEPKIQARIKASVKVKGLSLHEATEEYLARLAERTDFENAVNSGWWQKIKDFFVRMLAKVGIRLTSPLTDNELRYILWRSYDNLLHPNDRRNIFDKAREVQMQSRLKVGNYAESANRPAAEATPVAAELSRTDYASDDINNIVEKAKADGTYMKAPNGKPSNLNELQWAQVRTKAFKDWFGDWENDPENASKVVDENGEPKVMYHGTNLSNVNKHMPFWVFYDDQHFGTIGQAKSRVEPRKSTQEWLIKMRMPIFMQRVKYYNVFLNIRNPKRVSDVPKDWPYTQSEYWEEKTDRAKYQGHDGIVYLNEYEDTAHPADSWIAFKANQIKSATDNSGDFSSEDDDIRYSLRTKDKPKKTGKGYKVFVLKNGQLYPPMVANPNGEGTPIGVWLDADAAPVAGTSKTGRPQVKAGGKGTQGGSGQLAYRPGWHLGTIPYALQFNRKDENGERTLFPNNFVWAEVEYADDKDYQQEAHDEGVNANGKYQHSLAGLKRVPVDGSYKYRTNPDPNTDEWIITGAMRVNKILSREEVDELVRKAGREPQKVQDGDVLDQETVDALNKEIKATKEADEMGLLYRKGIDLTDEQAEAVMKHEKAIADATAERNEYRKNFFEGVSKEKYVDRLKEFSEDTKARRIEQDYWDAINNAKKEYRRLHIKQSDASRFYKEESEDELLYRDPDAWEDDVAQQMYEEAVAKDSLKWQEAWQDSMVGLKAIQDAIAAETGRVATGAEDAYRFENRMHGRSKNMTEQYDWKFYRPMLKAFSDFIHANGMTQQQGLNYLISKSGLERNVYYAFRDAAQAKLAEDIKKEREKLEKSYAARLIDEGDYILKKKDLEEKERNGVDDFIRQVRETLAYQRAKEDYQNGRIGYTEYLRRIESVIRSHVKDYDDYAKDYSGLTETFAKEWYDDAQTTKKAAQRAVDPKEKSQLWSEYDTKMRQAYVVARQVAEDAVFTAEGTTAETQQYTQQLWDKINAATKETLKQSYESGLMDRNIYNKVRAMFDYYIPLRGWEEDKASDVYTYMGKENVFNPAVKKTWGRKSQADNPLAYIGNIAVSTILSGHRNQMKQHFLNYVMNNPTSLVNISESWYENIAPEGESPVWILRTADTAGKSADEVVQIVNDFNDEMRQKQREGKAMPVTGRLRLDVHATSGQKAEHVVEVQRAGHTYQLYINGNPKAAQALNGTLGKAARLKDIPRVGPFISRMNHSMAAFFTSKNPAFVISNLSRDLNMAGASIAIKEDKEYNAKFIANVAKVLTPRLATGDVGKMGVRGLFGKGRGVTGMMPKLLSKWKQGKLDMSDETERFFKEFMEEGGETGFVNMLSIESFKEKMNKEIREMNGSSIFGNRGVKETTVRKGLRLMGETFEFYNRCAEDATRFIVYMTSRQTGRSLEDSIADAKDVTLNFNRKGTGEGWIGLIQDLFIFVNPAIQALANMYSMMKKKPLKFGAVTGAFVAGGVLIPVINQWLINMFGDDDDKESYWNLPPWVRKNNLVFWIPFTKNFVTIPLAQEFRVFYGVGEMIGSYAYDHPHHNAGLEVVESLADLIPVNPTGNGGNLIIDFTPTLAQPLMQITFNTDFTGKPIWKENQGNKYQPTASKAYVSTPKLMVKLSEGINKATGGDEDMRGWLEKYKAGQYLNNPAVWNHLLQGYFGGMYNTISKAIDTAGSLVQGEMPEMYRVPVVNRFINRPSERETSSTLGEDYWELIEGNNEFQNVLNKRRNKAKEGDEDAKRKLERMMQSEDYHRSLVISSYEKMIDEARKIEKSSSASDAEKEKFRQVTLELKEDMMEDIAAIDGGGDPVGVAIEKFDKSEDPRRRKVISSRISKEAGASKDPYGDKPDSDHAYHYQLLRTGEDVWEDAVLYGYQERLRDEGKKEEKETLSRERTKVHYPGGTNDPLFKLHGGKSDDVIMQQIRKNRKKLLEKYGLDKLCHISND